MYSVYQHWDPLTSCVVGRTYPPEFYTWIKNARVRNLFEKIAIETEEDYQNIIKKLQEFDVEILRPNLPEQPLVNGKYLPPPMCPRDVTVMIGTTFYESTSADVVDAYNDIKDVDWPVCNTWKDISNLPEHIKHECFNTFRLDQLVAPRLQYEHIIEHVRNQGNTVKNPFHWKYYTQLHDLRFVLNGAMVSRIGKDLFFGTSEYNQDTRTWKKLLDSEFPANRNHIVDTGGHSDGTYCPVAPGLILSVFDSPSYAHTYPGWEVVYLERKNWAMVEEFLSLKEKNSGRWWIPGFENDQDVVGLVEHWLKHWTGYVEETVFDVNMLIVDPKNVIVFNYNKKVFDALERYGITAHIIPFRHRYFWDGGIHCVTSDLNRRGHRQDFFT